MTYDHYSALQERTPNHQLQILLDHVSCPVTGDGVGPVRWTKQPFLLLRDGDWTNLGPACHHGTTSFTVAVGRLTC